MRSACSSFTYNSRYCTCITCTHITRIHFSRSRTGNVGSTLGDSVPRFTVPSARHLVDLRPDRIVHDDIVVNGRGLGTRACSYCPANPLTRAVYSLAYSCVIAASLRFTGHQLVWASPLSNIAHASANSIRSQGCLKACCTVWRAALAACLKHTQQQSELPAAKNSCRSYACRIFEEFPRQRIRDADGFITQDFIPPFAFPYNSSRSMWFIRFISPCFTLRRVLQTQWTASLQPPSLMWSAL